MVRVLVGKDRELFVIHQAPLERFSGYVRILFGLLQMSRLIQILVQVPWRFERPLCRVEQSGM